MNAQTPNQELAPIPPADALSIFSKLNGLEPWLLHVRREIDAFHGDVTTTKGRKDIASMAFKVAKSKTYLEEIGKAVSAEVKEMPKKIDAERKRVRDKLDQWRDEVRAPLTEWEASEEARIKQHTDRLGRLTAILTTDSGESLLTLRAHMSVAEGIEISPACEEFEAEYARAKDSAIRFLRAAIEKREKYEAEQAELAKLRAEAAEREAKERDERIAREAADRARSRAEEDARIEREKATRAAEAERARIETAAKVEREAGERRELELKLQAEQAERRAAETEARIKREAEVRLAAEKAETEKREANRQHLSRVNRAAVAAFVAGGIGEDVAKTVITLIAKKAIPAVTITY